MKTNENQPSPASAAQKPFVGATSDQTFFSEGEFFQPQTIAPIQAKLTIGQPGDQYEQEADRVASQVVNQIHAPAQSSPGELVQRQVEPQEELQAKPGITALQRQTNSHQMKSTQGGQASSELASTIGQARGSGQPLDASLQNSMGQAMGADFSGVKVHTDTTAHQLNQTIQAKAFTTGQDVFFRQGAYQPQNRSGQELIAHELTHVVQQNGGSSQQIHLQRTAIDDARVQVEQERQYREAADILERKLGPHLSPLPEVNAIADDMLARLHRIVDAWAEATKTGKETAYEQEFAFPDGRKYYGSFQLTGKEIKKVFEKPDQPLRKKLNLVYYCVRNGNFVKYLEIAANELRRTAQTGKASTQTVKVRDGHLSKEVSVKPNFAEQSGLKELWEKNDPVPGGKTSKEEVEADLKKRLDAQNPVFGSGFTDALGRSASNLLLGGDKSYGTYAGLSLEDTQTLTRSDVSDITTSEMRLLYDRQDKRQPLWISHSDKEKFKRKADTKILWEQGGENIEVASDSQTRRIAAETLSRLEGGISGSTDLMMHASKHLGYTSVNDLKRIRLALVAWMLSNRDHSFFEIMKIAGDYGAPFHIDKTQPGMEYENIDNFHPLDATQVDNFKTLVPNQQMPSYYMGAIRQGNVDATLPSKGTSADTFYNDLTTTVGLTLDATWKTDVKAKDLAQWLALKNRVAGLGLKTGRTEADLKFNRIAVQNLLKDSAWQHVVQSTVDTHARTNLRALIRYQFTDQAIVSDTDLTNIGVPPSLIQRLDEYKRYDVYRLYAAVRQTAPQMKSILSSRQDKVHALQNSLPFAAVRAWVGDTQARLILSSMLTRELGITRASTQEKADAVALSSYATYRTTYLNAQFSASYIASLGVPQSWLNSIARFPDPMYVHFRIHELSKKVGVAGFVTTEPPTSRANKRVRKALYDSSEYRSLEQALFVDARFAPIFVSYLVEKQFGNLALTAIEHRESFDAKRSDEKINELTALGLPRDVAETIPATDQKTTFLLLHDLRRSVLEAPFNKAQAAIHPDNHRAWETLKSSSILKKLATQKGFEYLALPIAATMVRQLVGATVLPPEALMLATGTDQRMAYYDKYYLGRTQIVNTATLATPTLANEAPTVDPTETTKREERYWATDDSAKEFAKNIAGTSPTVQAKLGVFRQRLKTDAGERDQVLTQVATKLLAQQLDPKPTLAEFKQQLFDGSVDEQIEAALGYMDTNDKLAQLDPNTKAAIDAIANLSDRERGALYQYTNQFHEQMGYATQFFSMETDFTTTDVANVTQKLRSLPFMLPMLQALHSALEQLPPYQAGAVYSGRNSHANLAGLTDQGRLDWAKRNYAVGQVISYAYPLSTAKDVEASFIPKPGTDVCLEIAQPIRTGKDIEYLSNKPNEKEVLFPQGARFQVVRIVAQPPAALSNDATKNKLWVVLQEI